MCEELDASLAHRVPIASGEREYSRFVTNRISSKQIVDHSPVGRGNILVV
jgi:hypothetical protein